MGAAFVVQAYEAEEARLAPWRAGVVVLGREVDEDSIHRGCPLVVAIHGDVPQGWFIAERAAA